MKLLGADIENFMAISKGRINLADRGLVLVQGQNEDETSADSNGAGKSSVFDAISWCLWGTTARGESGDAIINRVTGKDCRVCVLIEDGDKTYQIARHRKHKKGKNTLTVFDQVPGGPAVDLTKGTDKLTQAVVEQILGCSKEVFDGAVYAGQERMPDLPGKTDKELKTLIEEASGATLLEAAYQEAMRRFRETQLLVTDGKSRLERAFTAVASTEDAIADTKLRHSSFDVQKVDSIKRLHTEGQAKKKTIEDLEATIAAGGKDDVLRGIAECDAKIAAVTAEVDADRALTARVEAARSAMRVAESQYKTATYAVEAAKAKLEELDYKIGCPCERCARPFSAEDIAPAKGLAAAEIGKAELQRDTTKKALGDALRDVNSALERQSAHRASMTDISAVSAERASLQERLDQISAWEHSLKRGKVELASLVAQIKAKRDETNPFVALLGDLASKLTVLKADVDIRKGELEKALADQVVAELVTKVYAPAGVRAFLLDEVTPFLNEQTAKYLGTLSDGNITATWTTLVKTAKGELREKFSIEVDNKNGGGTFGLISGGEKRKVRIACALALQDLVARRASKPIELFIGDEIDDALDEAGRQRLMDILQEKAKERGSVFIISHSDLKDWIRNQITVRRKSGQSTLEEVTA